jgi:Zn-dependent peptidase ImmA (M78 family)
MNCWKENTKKLLHCIDYKRGKMSELSKLGIARRAAYELRRKCTEEMRLQPSKVCNIMEVYDSVLYPEYGIGLDMNQDLGTEVLGKTTRNENGDVVILINKSAVNSPQFVFTLAHEIGHAMLHLMPLDKSTDILLETSQREREADTFAEHFLMPDDLVEDTYVDFFGMTYSYPYIGPGNYFINHKRVHIYSILELGICMAQPLTKYFFNISKESLGRKLLKMGLINNIAREDFWHTKNVLNRNFFTPMSTNFSKVLVSDTILVERV